MSKGKPFLSVIIPAYRAESFIKESIDETFRALTNTNYNFEIICVIDGKVDKSFERAKNAAIKYLGRVKVFGYEKNRGKGYAVRYGMAKAKGDPIGFIDAGEEIDPKSFSNLLRVLKEKNAEIVVGSKRHPDSMIAYPLHRRVLSMSYFLFIKLLYKLGINDTQAGIKIYRRRVVKKLLPRLTLEGFAFDIEMLSVARFLGFSKIYEAPIKVEKRGGGSDSTITAGRFLMPVLGMFWDTLLVFYRLKSAYYDDRNRGNWIVPSSLTFKV